MPARTIAVHCRSGTSPMTAGGIGAGAAGVGEGVFRAPGWLWVGLLVGVGSGVEGAEPVAGRLQPLNTTADSATATTVTRLY